MVRCYSCSRRQDSAITAFTLCRRTTTVGLSTQLYVSLTVSNRKAIPACLEREEYALPLFHFDKDLAEIWPQNSGCGLPNAKWRCLIIPWTCLFCSCIGGENRFITSYSGGLCCSLRVLTSLNTATGGGNIPTHAGTAVV